MDAWTGWAPSYSSPAAYRTAEDAHVGNGAPGRSCVASAPPALSTGNTVISALGVSEATSIEVCSGCPGTSSGSKRECRENGIMVYLLNSGLLEYPSKWRRIKARIYYRRNDQVEWIVL